MTSNQRAAIAMTPTAVATLCDAERTAILCSVLSDGHIHAVPMWFVADGQTLIFTTKAASQKVRNLRRDPRATVLIESGATYLELTGVEMIGHVDIVDDPQSVVRYVAALSDRYGTSTDSSLSIEQKARKRVALRFTPRRIVSWDHAKHAPPVPD